MIAFSSNLHVVTVYAFGLAADASADEVASTSHSGVRQLDRDEEAIDEDSDSILTEDGGVSLGSSSSIDEQEDSLSDSGESSYEGGRYHLNSDLPHSPELFEGRKQDFVIQLGQPNRVRDWRQHNANIPNIAFCNTAEDPYGRFLISSDIDARTIVWDLKYASPVRFLYRQEYDDFTAGGMDFRRSGWGALWLDKQMFSHASTVYQACGTEELGFTYEETSHYDHQCVFSNTKCLDYIPGNNKRWMGVPHPDEPMESPAPAVRSDATSPINTPLLDPTSAPDLDDEDDEVDSTRITARMTEAVYRSLSAEEARNYHSMFWPFMTMSFHLPESTTPIPSTPLLLLSMETMHLFQSADFQAVSSTSPVVFMDKPFHQRIGPDVDETLLLHFDRINLSVQIPELGVVIVGSGKGRVAVCTLHQTTQNPLLLDLDRAAQPGGRTGAADRSADGAHSPRQDNPIYTFRVDHILPFQWQETMGQRPETWLGLCVAVGHRMCDNETI
ncbi:hypothetical protein FH972_023611 [Carpinus fangiana]|uniref:Uncharacterized protein n=1 Tax=Carpinus fangiana TaxID=176857 RepID=A0A5N6KVY3_9ROSI|nr:hypothetical protein FH972_023611 [Carpinus fangiana]